MAEFKIDRFKYNWKGDWAPSSDYKRDDIARINGRSYVCIKGHTSSGDFGSDLNATIPNSVPPQPDPRWIVMTVSKSFIGEWVTATNYNKGDLVLNGGTVWLCIEAHNGQSFATEIANWEVFTKSISFVSNWTPNTTYAHGALVKYNGYVYKCLVAHIGSATLEDNQTDWLEFHVGDEYRNSWITETVYRKNDIVRYGASVFRCTETHTSGVVQLDDTKFTLEFPGTQFDGEWSSLTAYNLGDIVRYGGHVYYAVANNIDSDPSRVTAGYTSGGDSTQDWIVLAKTYNFRGDWDITSPYKTGDIVVRGGYLYQILRDVNINDGDDSTLVWQDPEIYELIIPGKKFVGPWSTTGYYAVGEIVYHLGTAYFCNFEHQATAENFPGDNGSGYDYWDILVQAGQPGGLHDKGDLLTFGLSRTGADDGSTVGDTRLKIGDEVGQALSVTTDLDLFWRNFLTDSDVIYVSNEGINRPGYGRTPLRPFKTVKYASEFVEDNFIAGNPVKISIATGYYEEIGPITVPAGCAIMGDELRSTTIVANPRKQDYYDNYNQVQDYLTFTETFILDLLLNVPITPLTGNTETQVLNGPFGSEDVAQRCVELFTDYKNNVEFNVFTGEISPVMTGSNTLNADTNFVNGGENISQNIIFISGQIYAFLLQEGFTVDKDTVYEDVNSIFRGLARDLKYSGNYATLLASRRYINAANGSQNDDLFWVRDTTGIRQCTLKGLVGTLNPPGVFDLYQRPTGGAFVALDPGWGPDDSRVWINNRSPYIQGVTNIGSSCVGKKVDGSLHNGGNKSMTSNDFTQVLSDGIGAWITNGGRAELVSVFTYYCAVGYFAEDGGIIRATNGNNSYGDYGSIADGNDPTEIPDTATIWNRNNQAFVDTADSGGTVDSIALFEYEHCGENYKSASATITGAGAGVNVEFDDFRDGSLYNVRLINTKGSGSEGGTNYLVRQGNAQETLDASQYLKLSTSDATQFYEDVAGMRILVIQGTGYGQYGYISGYSAVTRQVTVSRESDDQPGWDHLIPGTPLVAAFDSTARYRIEPRMAVSHPGFTSTVQNLPAERTFIDVDFGGITNTYGGLTGGLGTGETFGLPQIEAIFNVSRRGSDYVVSINNAGAGYAENDRLTIRGDLLGGATPDNDLIIDVLTTSDDSTNSIATIKSSGTGRGGRFVALADPNFVVYSDTGTTWQESNLDITATWIKVLANKNRFIAIASGTNQYNFSYTGENWTTRALPATEDWSDAAASPTGFVVVANGATEFAYSTDGLTWSSSSTVAADTYTKVAYGQGRYVCIAESGAVITSDNNGNTWTSRTALPLGGAPTIVSLVYGDNRFIIIRSDGSVMYSVDKGETFIQGENVPQNGGSSLSYVDCKYAQGVFMVISTDGGTPTSLNATTEDGLVWRQNNLASSQAWKTLSFASLDGDPKWVLLADGVTLGGVANIKTGKRAKLRSDTFTGIFQRVKIWDPGSGYSPNPDNMTITVTDTQFVTEVELEKRIGNGTIAQPSFKSRGSGYRSNSTVVTLTGDGYADIIPEANTITLAGVDTVPGPGVQIRINTILDPLTEDPSDLKLFNGVKITDLGDDGTGNATRLVQMQISPSIDNEDNLAHATGVELRSLYSQARITGHDFLDIGTGNFIQSNYPELYADGNYFVAAPENEVYETNGGRVFYTSTDQDGNFRTGELFSVQQSTGIVTISAEFFDLDGLSELSLGGVRLGGSGAAVRDFSTDPTMSEDSNNVVPTQRAIATFLADRLSVGGEDLETNRLVAGQVIIGGEANEFNMNNDETLQINVPVDFSGVDAFGNLPRVQGTFLSQMLVLKTFNDTTQ